MQSEPPTIERIVPNNRLVELSDGSQWHVHPQADFVLDHWAPGDQARIKSFPVADYTHLITNVDGPSPSIQVRQIEVQSS